MYHIKNDKRARQSSVMMYRALQELMKEKAFAAITITELVERAGVGRATFYRAFDVVEDVLLMQCDYQMQELADLLLDEKKGKIDTATGLRIFLQYWYDNHEVIGLLYQAQCFESLIKSFSAMFRRLFAQRHTKADIPEKFADYVLAMQSGAVLGLLMQWFIKGRDIPPDEMARMMEYSMKSFEAQHHKK